MIFRNPFDPANSRLLVEDAVLFELAAFRQIHAHAAEAGGILLGYRRDEHVHVVRATPPGPSDTRSRYRFCRFDESHARIAMAEWRSSGETMDYVGEWHTHPETDPRPSALDLNEWRKICSRREDPMVFFIQGTFRQWVGVGLGRAIRVSDGADIAVANSDPNSGA